MELSNLRARRFEAKENLSKHGGVRQIRGISYRDLRTARSIIPGACRLNKPVESERAGDSTASSFTMNGTALFRASV